MSLAAETRRAVRAEPFMFEALRAGVLNYSAAARQLDVGAVEPVVAALRRYAEELPDRKIESRDTRVTMQSGLAIVDDADEDGILAVGGNGVVDGGSLTGVLATGAVDAAALARVCSRLATEKVEIEAAGVAGNALVVVVGRRDGPDAVRTVEDALVAVATTPTD